MAPIDSNGRTGGNKRKLLSGYGLVTSFGFVLVAGILVAYYGGSYIDRWLGTTPWISLLLMFLATVTAFHNLLRELRARSKDES